MSKLGKERFLLISSKVFYPLHWSAFLEINVQYEVESFVIAIDNAMNLPSVHQQLGEISVLDARSQLPVVDIRFMPKKRFFRQIVWLWKQFLEIKPDAIWIQEEPTDIYLMLTLLYYWLWKRTRIVTAVCENIFVVEHPVKRTIHTWLWSRLNGLLAVAQESVRGIRKAGMPQSVPFLSLVAGAAAPPLHLEPIQLPFEHTDTDFIISFVGRITEEKGWQVLLNALEKLPDNFKCLLAGDGPQVKELLDRLESSILKERVFYLGIFPKEELWRVYKVSNCFVLPSLTTPTWKEQFGGVLADAMAMGLPIIGSNSGSIPEVVGPAGLIVEEGNAEALRNALLKLSQDPVLCDQLGGNGKKRFEDEFNIPAYSRKIALLLGLRSSNL